MRNSRVSQNSDWVSWGPMGELWSHLELEKPYVFSQAPVPTA